MIALMQPPRPKRIDYRQFRALKQEALALLEWALDDVSPDPSDPHQRIHLKMGIEREGHFVLPELKDPACYPDPDDWEKANRYEKRAELARRIEGYLRADESLPLDRFYADKGGTLTMEATTLPLAPREAVKAITAICNASRDIARKHFGIDDACYGSLPSDFLHKLAERYQYPAFIYAGEVFNDAGQPCRYGEESGSILVGRGQHANVSPWFGERSILAAEPLGRKQLLRCIVKDPYACCPV